MAYFTKDLKLNIMKNNINMNTIISKDYTNINLLASYLDGLIEGDGSIILRKGKLEKTPPAIIFTFHKNEKPLYEKIKTLLNSGNIYEENRSICRYKITNSIAIINLINLVNGYFRTPKIKVLYSAIDNLNKWHKTNIIKLPLDNSDIGSNAWLAGFTDADGNFSIKLTGSYKSENITERGRIQCVFSINQNEIHKKTNESCVPFMTKLANYFECNLNHRLANNAIFKESSALIVFYVQSDKKHYIVINYFDKYPLMSSKYLNYLCYKEGLSYLSKRLNENEISKIQILKNSMNNKRIYYNWDHLDNFYNFV